MIVGAPNASQAVVYTRNADGETWNEGSKATLQGNAGTSFGASVAISGDRVVVGMPDANAKYSSAGQPIAGYELNLGASGAAVTYAYANGSWTRDRLLMPDDNALPYDTSYTDDTTPADWNRVWVQNIGWLGIGGHETNDSNGRSIHLGAVDVRRRYRHRQRPVRRPRLLGVCQLHRANWVTVRRRRRSRQGLRVHDRRHAAEHLGCLRRPDPERQVPQGLRPWHRKLRRGATTTTSTSGPYTIVLAADTNGGDLRLRGGLDLRRGRRPDDER